jgi:septal ring factor EnvC (AmiA/AmiB activator)
MPNLYKNGASVLNLDILVFIPHIFILDNFGCQHSASLSSKEVDYQKLSVFTNETKRSLDLANSILQQLEEELHRTKNDFTSKTSSIDSMNVKLQTLSSENKEAAKKLTS